MLHGRDLEPRFSAVRITEEKWGGRRQPFTPYMGK